MTTGMGAPTLPQLAAMISAVDPEDPAAVLPLDRGVVARDAAVVDHDVAVPPPPDLDLRAVLEGVLVLGAVVSERDIQPQATLGLHQVRASLGGSGRNAGIGARITNPSVASRGWVGVVSPLRDRWKALVPGPQTVNSRSNRWVRIQKRRTRRPNSTRIC